MKHIKMSTSQRKETVEPHMFNCSSVKRTSYKRNSYGISPLLRLYPNKKHISWKFEYLLTLEHAQKGDAIEDNNF